jgi:5-(carboxyamino)imidazole ribonucleotide mutase
LLCIHRKKNKRQTKKKYESIHKIVVLQKKQMKEETILVSIIMGSDSDMKIMEEAVHIIKSFNISYEVDIVSAHRTPEKLYSFANNAHSRGVKVIIAGAGGAAHLPGMVAAISPLPVIGVPIKSTNSIDGWDSILSILQMPGGVPVATVALNGAKNAGLLAVQILSTSNVELQNMLIAYKKQLNEEVQEKAKKIQIL